MKGMKKLVGANKFDSTLYMFKGLFFVGILVKLLLTISITISLVFGTILKKRSELMNNIKF